MKKMLLMCGALLVVSAAAASAQGDLNLNWNTCYGNGSVLNKNFACTNSLGSNTLVASFHSPALPTMSGVEGFINIATAPTLGVTLPSWWSMFNATGCRTAANNPLSANFIGGADTQTGPTCFDFWGGAASGNVAAYNMNWKGDNTANIDVAGAVPVSGLVALDGVTETFAFNVVINNKLSSGTGACTGCLTPACLVFRSLLLTQPVGVGDLTITHGGAQSYVTWQGGAVGGNGCPAATPTRNSTWGSVKALYR